MANFNKEIISSEDINEQKLLNIIQEMKAMLIQKDKTISQLNIQNHLIKDKNEDLKYELDRASKDKQKLNEHAVAQTKMFQQTSEYMTTVIEELGQTRQEVETTNQELAAKNNSITEQKKILEETLKKLQDNHDEIEMQKEYLVVAMEELQQSHDEMEMQKDYLMVTIGELEKSQKEVEEQSHLLEQAFKELDRAHSDTTSSINYAKRIQDAMLSDTAKLKDNVRDSFVFYKPKDIVSGDFYWFNTEGDKLVIVAADCTGHGVPGALMSMIGINILNEIIRTRKIIEPDKILYYLNLSINIVLKQKETNNRDGMDIAICTINLKDRILEYAGAHNPLLIIQDGKHELIKGDKIGVGGFDNKQEYKYTKHTRKLKPDTTLYMYSDGYQDQFGGENARKFMSRRFRELLINNHENTMSEQKQTLDDTLQQWLMGKYNQLDDVLVIGINI